MARLSALQSALQPHAPCPAPVFTDTTALNSAIGQIK